MREPKFINAEQFVAKYGNWYTEEGTETGFIGTIKYLVEQIPAADIPRWIPCSERLPEDDTLMLVNYIDRRLDVMDIWIGWHEMENVWYIDGEAHSREFDNEVIAWMPLPEPWKGEEERDGFQKTL